MAAQNVLTIPDLIKALTYKYYTPSADSYSGHSYDPDIFKQARRTFPKVYSNISDDAQFTKEIVEGFASGKLDLESYTHPDSELEEGKNSKELEADKETEKQAASEKKSENTYSQNSTADSPIRPGTSTAQTTTAVLEKPQEALTEEDPKKAAAEADRIIAEHAVSSQLPEKPTEMEIKPPTESAQPNQNPKKSLVNPDTFGKPMAGLNIQEETPEKQVKVNLKDFRTEVQSQPPAAPSQPAEKKDQKTPTTGASPSLPFSPQDISSLESALNAAEPEVVIVQSPPPPPIPQSSSVSSEVPSSSPSSSSGGGAPASAASPGSGGGLPGIPNPAGMLGRNAGRQAGAAGARAIGTFALSNPYVLAAIIIGTFLLLIILLIVLGLNRQESILGLGGGVANAGPDQSALKITKSGPESAKLDDEFTYTISVTYSGTGQADTQITDTLDKNIDYVDAPDGEYNESTRMVSWDLTKIGANQKKDLTLKVKANHDDVWVQNVAEGKILKTYSPQFGAGGKCPTQEQLKTNSDSPQTCQYLNPGIDIFDTNFSEEQIKQYVATYQPLSSRSTDDFEAKTRDIVTEAESVGLNPIIPLSYWYTESKFGEGMGCPAVTNKFQNQLDCILGGPAGSVWQGPPHVIYTPSTRCARDKDASSPACKFIASQIATNPQVYNSISVQIPINNFDALAEMIGPRAPNLEGSGKANYNCTHTYNLLIQVAESVNSCSATPASSTTDTNQEEPTP